MEFRYSSARMSPSTKASCFEDRIGEPQSTVCQETYCNDKLTKYRGNEIQVQYLHSLITFMPTYRLHKPSIFTHIKLQQYIQLYTAYIDAYFKYNCSTLFSSVGSTCCSQISLAHSSASQWSAPPRCWPHDLRSRIEKKPRPNPWDHMRSLTFTYLVATTNQYYFFMPMKTCGSEDLLNQKLVNESLCKWHFHSQVQLCPAALGPLFIKIELLYCWGQHGQIHK